MELTEIIAAIENTTRGKLNRKRVACAHCGNTWIEFFGLIVEHRENSEDLCLRIGIESENCQTCRYRPLECPKCGSKEAYEIKFAEAISEAAPITFKGIARVTSRNRKR